MKHITVAQDIRSSKNKILWYDADGHLTSFNNVVNEIRKFENIGCGIYIGTDSHSRDNSYQFASTVCYHGMNYANYFYCRYKIDKVRFNNIKQRLFHEAHETIELARLLKEEIDPLNVELHFDVNSQKKFKSYVVKETVTNYANSYNFKSKIKPDSWASSFLADRYAK